MRYIFILFFASLAIQQTQAQIHVGLEAGFAWQWASSEGVVNTEVAPSLRTETVVPLALGQGASYGANLAWLFRDGFELELGLSFMNGQTQKRYSHILESTAVSAQQAQLFRLTPSLKWMVGTRRLRPFCRFGGGLGLGGRVKSNLIVESVTQGTYRSKFVYSGGLTYHFTTGMGLEYRPSVISKTRLFVEARLFSGIYSPNKGELILEDQNGFDILAQKTLSEREIRYRRSLNLGSPGDPAQPTLSLRQYFPLGSFGVYFGMAYRLRGDKGRGK